MTVTIGRRELLAALGGAAAAWPAVAQATATMALRNVGLASMAVAPDFIPKTTRERPSRSMRPRELHHGFSSTTRLRSVPMPEISTSSTSPGFIHKGGLRR